MELNLLTELRSLDSHPIKRTLLTKSKYSVHYLRTYDIFFHYIKLLILLRIAMLLYHKRFNERTTNVQIIWQLNILVYYERKKEKTVKTLIRG